MLIQLREKLLPQVNMVLRAKHDGKNRPIARTVAVDAQGPGRNAPNYRVAQKFISHNRFSHCDV